MASTKRLKQTQNASEGLIRLVQQCKGNRVIGSPGDLVK